MSWRDHAKPSELAELSDLKAERVRASARIRQLRAKVLNRIAYNKRKNSVDTLREGA